MRASILVFAFAVPWAGVAASQTQTATLPSKLSGRWSILAPTGRTFIDTMSVALDAPAADGSVTGRLTAHGVGCGALDEPLRGTWNGSELRFESTVRPNVNVARMNGDCGSGRIAFVLARKDAEQQFVGEARRDGLATPVQVTLSP